MPAIEIYREKPAAQKILVGNERGNVLIYTLILLILVTILGLSASQTATVDIQISGNHMNYKKNFYKAEGAALNAIQAMEGADDIGSLDFISSNPAFLNQIYDPAQDNRWDDNTFVGAQVMPSDIDNTNAKYVAYTEGVIHTGESLDMTKTKIYQYKVFGRNKENNGKSVIEIGYRRIQ